MIPELSVIIRYLTTIFLASIALLGCSSSTKNYDVDLSGVSKYHFKNPAESVGLQRKIIEVMDQKGYMLASSADDAIVFDFSADNNAWGTGRGVLVTYNGRPVMSSESSNAGFGTLLLAGSERSRMESNVAGAVSRNIPDISK